LALIKLCYLQQALELVNDENGVSKKKLVETSKPVAFRKIEPVEIRREQDAKLIIETVAEEKITLHEEPKIYNTGGENTEPPASKTKPQTSNARIAALDKIRKQVQGNGSHENGNGARAKPLESEELQQAWNEYTSELKTKKNSAWQGFEMARLQIQDANNFVAIVSSNIDLRFIEQEGLKVSQFLREKLQNNQLQFLIVMQENKEAKNAEISLTVREQYQKMIEQYPLVKELKDRLRLELDY
jgi:DNA polymerase-3 subunit gamma/tau